MSDVEDESLEFKITPGVLRFPKNRITTQVISVRSSCFDNGLMLKSTNNLSDNFITELPKNFIDNERNIHITYRGAETDKFVYLRNFEIFFRDSLNQNSVQKVLVTITDEEEEEQEAGQAGPSGVPKTKQENPLECEICLEDFTTDKDVHLPIVLKNCSHTICYSCVVTMMKGYKYVECPFDRIRSYVNFKLKNFNLMKVILQGNCQNPQAKPWKVQKIENIDDPIEDDEREYNKAPVVPCHEDPLHESTCFCSSCELDFCHECFLKVHPVSKTFADHKLVSIFEKPIVLPDCFFHPGSKADFTCTIKNCPKFNLNYCYKCAYEDHKHETPVHLEEVLTTNKKTLHQLLRDLGYIKKNFIEKAGFLRNGFANFEEAWKAHRDILQDINARDEMHIIMMNFKDVGVHRLQAKTNDELSALNQIQREIKKMLLMKTDLHKADGLIKRANAMCEWKVGEYEHLVPQKPYNFPEDGQITTPCSIFTSSSGSSSSSSQSSAAKRKLIEIDDDDDVIELDRPVSWRRPVPPVIYL